MQRSLFQQRGYSAFANNCDCDNNSSEDSVIRWTPMLFGRRAMVIRKRDMKCEGTREVLCPVVDERVAHLSDDGCRVLSL